MLNWKTLVAAVALAPFAALFIGAGFLFYHVGQTWDARATDALIAGLVATCGGGAVIIGVLLAFIIGIPFAIRMFGESGYAARRGWGEQMTYPHLPMPRSSSWHQPPPLLEDKQRGSWQTLNQGYDVWEPEPDTFRDPQGT